MRHDLQDQEGSSGSWEMRALRTEDRNNTMNEPERVNDVSSAEPDNDSLNRRTRFKLDVILLPFLSLLFCLNHLDKTNIGNAETGGFSRDAGLEEGDINTAMAWFFAFFVALQPLGAALGRKIGMARFVPACMSLWGVCTILHIWVRSRWQLVLLRITIAILEAGFYPTTVSYLSLFYTRYEFATRLGFFYGQAAVSGALGGILSWAVFSRFAVVEDSGIKSWQILFLVEGCLTLIVASAGFVWLPHSADSAWFLNATERMWAERRIALDQKGRSVMREQHEITIHDTDENGDDNKPDDEEYDAERRLLTGDPTTQSHEPLTTDRGLQKHEIEAAVFQYRIWHLLVCNILSAIPATAFGIFLPVVVKDMMPPGRTTPAESNLLAVPPFALGAGVLLCFTYWSDRSHRRLFPILVGLVILLFGLTVTVITPRANIGIRYAGLCILLGGSYIASPLTVAWISNNTPEPGKRAILLGINGWGNLAGVSSAFLFTPGDASSGYAVSFGVTLVCVGVAFIGYAFFMLLVKQINNERIIRTNEWSDREKTREAMFGDVSTYWLTSTAIRRGDDRMTYRYTY